MGEKQKSGNFLDSLGKVKESYRFFGLVDFRRAAGENAMSALFSRRGICQDFFTENSKLYITPSEYVKLKKGKKMVDFISRLDSVMERDWNFQGVRRSQGRLPLSREIRKRYFYLRNQAIKLIGESMENVPMAKMWNLSIVGAVILGMFTMTLVYRYLGQNVSAKMADGVGAAYSQDLDGKTGKVLGANTNEDINNQIDTDYITRILESEDSGSKIKNKDFEKEIREMVKGYPIEKMVSQIAKKDRIVAAFLVAIARKESSWGVHVPVYNGQDCYNLWGYRGKNPVGTGGHTCFDSPEDAVDTVAKRIEYLVSETKRDTADKMVVWKCGYDCSWDNKAAVKKWISDVDTTFRKLNKE